MISAEKSVYISYSWKKEKRKKTVEKIMAAFSAVGVEVKRDEKKIGYGESIKEYMNELAAGGAIILVLSEEYFKSRYCMYELLEIYRNNRKEFRQRIFPVVLKGTKFHCADDRIPYIKFWEEETVTLNTKLNSVSREHLSAASHNELRDYADFCRMSDDLLTLIGDMNYLTEEEHLETGFSALIERMFPQPAPDGGGGTDKTGKTAKIGQNTTGNDNVFSGSGDITVNHININTAATAPQSEKEDSPDVGFKLKIAYNIPNLPPNYLPRPEYIDEFRAALQKESNLGVEGMGGIGKSVLAAALAHDEAVQAAFPDGIFWLTFGQKVEGDALLVQQNNILNLLGHKEQENSLDLSKHKLNLVLYGKRCLFIIDDIWDRNHLKCFDTSGTACRFLLTSRKADVLDRLDMERKRIDLLSEEQALVMLAQYARCILADLPKEAAEIVKECGYLPLAVAAIGSMVRGKPADRWQLALCKLQEAKLDKISCKFDYQYENLFRALQVSVEALPEAQQQYYKTLAVFPEDANIQESAIVLYWEYCAVSDDEPQDVIDALVDSSLLTRVDDKFLRLHDLLRDYLISQTEDVVVLHKTLLDAYKAKYPGGWHKIPVEAYSYFHNYWYIHAKIVGGDNFTAEIADDLIFCQPNISLNTFKKSLEFVDYQLPDIAHHLLIEGRDIFVLRDCLHSLENDGKKEAHLLLKERQPPNVEYACLEFLEEEGKQHARRLIKESDSWFVLGSCLKLLGDEAKPDARRIFTENKHPELTGICLIKLGDEAKEDARQFFGSSKNEVDLIYLIFIREIKDEDIIQRLLEITKHDDIKRICQEKLDRLRKDDLTE